MRVAGYFRRFGLLTEHYAARQLKAMQDKGHDVRVFCVEDSLELPPAPFPVTSLYRGRGIRSRVHLSIAARAAVRLRRDGYLDPLTSAMARRAIARFRPDVVYSMYGNYAVDLTGIAERSPLVFHLAGADIASAPKKTNHYQRSLRRLVEISSLVLCGSRFLCERAHAFSLDPTKLRVHYLGIEADDAGREERDDFVVAIGRLARVKGVDDTVRVFAGAMRLLNNTTTRLVICGEGPERPVVEQAIRDCGFGARVELRGAVPNRIARELLKRARAFIQMNRTTGAGQAEGLGGTLLEAAAVCTPIIATDSGGTREAVDAGSVSLVDEGDLEGGARSLAACLADPATAYLRAFQNRDFFMKNHFAPAQDAKFEAILVGAASGGKGVG